MEILGDWGHRYAETDLSRFPVEPFNTLSNLLFLLVALYWWQWRRAQAQSDFRHFLNQGLPLLFVGFLGGSLYHATRAHWLWTLMDVGPIYLLGLLTGYYHWRLIGLSPQRALLFMGGLFLALFSGVALLFPMDSPHRYTLGYCSLAIPVIIPILIDLHRQSYRLWSRFLCPVVLIGLALSLRSLDSHHVISADLPMGTHWLWHLMGALTCHFLLVYMAHRAGLVQTSTSPSASAKL